jgi:tetratricopeptide (TPR) repeat protein
MRSAQPARAIEAADLALDLAEHLGLERIVAETFNNKGSSLGLLGRKREAAALVQAAVDVAHAGGFVTAEIRALANLGICFDDQRRARDTVRDAAELARRVGNRSLATWAEGEARTYCYIIGDGWDEALPEGATDDGAATGRDTESPFDAIRWLATSGFYLAARGESTDAILADLEVLSTKVSDPYALSSIRILRSDRAFHAGDYGLACDEAVRAAEDESLAPEYLGLAMRPALWGGDLARARRVADLLDADPSTALGVAADRIAARAGIAALEGRVDDAIAGYRDARARLRAIGSDFEVARISLDFVLLVGADHPAVRDAAAEARVIFERVRARPYLDRLDAAMAERPPAPDGAGERLPV